MTGPGVLACVGQRVDSGPRMGAASKERFVIEFDYYLQRSPIETFHSLIRPIDL